MSTEHTNGGPEGQAESLSWAESLVDALETAKDRLSLAIGEEERAGAQAAYDRAHNDVIQALTGSQRTEEDDFLTVRDQFALAAMQGFLVGVTLFVSSNISEQAYKMADAMMAERARRMAGGPQ